MSGRLIVEPRFMGVIEWTDLNGLWLNQFGSIPRLDNPAKWQDWGANLLNLPSIHGIALPDPYQFDDWRRWADRVNEALTSVSLP